MGALQRGLRPGPSAAPPPIEVCCANGRPALERLLPEWRRLWERCPGAPSFLRPEWLGPWARHFESDAIRVLVARRGGRIVGLLPLFSHQRDGVPVLSLLGAGVSDTLDVLVDPVHAEATRRRLLASLSVEAGADWDSVELQDLPADSPTATAPVPDPLASRVTPEQPHPVLELPRSEEDLEAALPDGFRSNLRYVRRRAAAEGGLRFVTATAQTLDEWVDALFRLHAARWAARGESGVLSDARVQAFHREAAHGLCAAGSLRLFGLTVGERVAAVYYGMCERGRACYYLGGFDPELRRLSPGTLVVAHALGDAIRQGAREFDFLRGQEPYKYAWGARDRPHVKRTLTRRRAPAAIAEA